MSERKLKAFDIWDACVEALSGQFVNFFDNKQVNVVQVASRTDLRDMVKKNKEIEFPFFATQISNVSITENSYNPFALRHTGMRGPSIKREVGPGNIPEQFYMFKFIPTSVQYTIRFITNDVKDVYAFTKTWINYVLTNGLNFDITIADADINIPLELDRQISYPDLELEDMGSLFTLEVSLVMKGYTGEITKTPSITKYKFAINTINSDTLQTNGKPTIEQIASVLSNLSNEDDTVV